MKRLFLFLTLMCLCAFGDKVSIPHLKGKSPIVVDGKINEDEYALSSLVGGLLLQQKNFLVNRDVEIYLTADEEALFLAARMSVENSDPDGGLVYQFQNKPKQHLCNDDCMEFFVASATEPLIYQILVNSSNVREAICHKAAKGSKVELNYECNGCIRNGYWEQELRIPWKSIPGINPEEFRFNCARNFVAGGLGYASFTGQKDIRDVKSMLQVKSVYGFGGVRLHGIDTSLCRGIFQLRCNGDGALSFSARCYNKDKTFIVNKPNEAQNILNDNSGKYVSLHVSHPKYGEVFRRSYVPFKLGGQLGGGPVTESIMLDGIGNLYLRHYPENAKCSVILSALGKAKSAKCEIVSPEGKVFAGDFVLQNDNSWKAMVHLPPKRPFGKYTGNLLLKEDAGERRMDNAFSFEEKNFEWLNNKIGISNKILPPFTPIEVNEANVLSTVQRKHFLAENGLLKQVNSMGNDILAAPMHFELHCQGKLLVEKNSKLQIVKKAPNRVVTKSRADFGAWKYQASTEWDYDGFALVKVRFTPPKDALAEKLTLRIPLKTSETTLMHALVDGARGNPGGYIPNGEGCVWTSENMLRWKNKQGVTVVPGEFVPYVWVGGEYRGICLLFDSPMGFALEDGKPMLHIFRNGDTLELQCDIINLKFGKPGAAVDFSFAFQVTPVKPLLKEWRNWSFQLGSKLPGMKAVQICESGSDLGFFDAFCVIPNNKDYSYAKAFRETIRKRQVPLYIMQKIDTDAREKLKAQQLRVRGKVDNNSINRALNEMQTRFMQVGMTADAVIKYSCQSLINMQDEAYQYHKAEWATRYQYREGHVDRIFSTRRMMEYELWAYKKMLEA
ncbi:MAG: hypothetical protein IJS08_09605, partial [Victivallales bacterium]|nr:hypothetical protein [Victivallales bacterium]